MGYGALISGLLTAGGSVAGGLLNQQKGGFSQDYINNLFNWRLGQINKFQTAMTDARNKFYNVSLPSYQNNVMKQFMPNIESQIAGRGGQVGGGAFSSALAREAMNLENQGQMGQYQDIQSLLTAVAQARQGAAGSAMGVAGQNFGYAPPNPMWAELGKLAGTVGGGLMANYFNQQPSQGTPGISSLPGAMAYASQGQYSGVNGQGVVNPMSNNLPYSMSQISLMRPY